MMGPYPNMSIAAPQRKFFNCKDADMTQWIVGNFPQNWGQWTAAHSYPVVSIPEQDPLMYVNQIEMLRHIENDGYEAIDADAWRSATPLIYIRPPTQDYNEPQYTTSQQWAAAVAAATASYNGGAG